MSKDLLKAQKNSNYDKLYLDCNGFKDEDFVKKEYPKKFKELLKEFDV